jgi:hypothetical protein
MLRRSTRTTPLYAVALAAMVLAFFAAPAAAHKDGRGGKPAIGEVASFDGTTLTVTMNDGSSFAGAVSDDVQIKVEHRGHKEHGKGHKKPSNGSLEDLTAGAKVLRIKVKCDEVTKLRIRRAPATTTEPVVVATEDLESDVEAPETEVEEPETEEDGCADEAEDDSDDVGDDDGTEADAPEAGDDAGSDDDDLLDDATDLLDPAL